MLIEVNDSSFTVPVSYVSENVSETPGLGINMVGDFCRPTKGRVVKAVKGYRTIKNLK